MLRLQRSISFAKAGLSPFPCASICTLRACLLAVRVNNPISKNYHFCGIAPYQHSQYF